jgi:hypothetical protein
MVPFLHFSRTATSRSSLWREIGGVKPIGQVVVAVPARQLMCARDGISRLLNPDSPCAICLSRRCSGSDNPGCQGPPASSATPGNVARSYIGTAIARCGRWPEPIHFCSPKTGSREQARGPTLEFVHGHGSEPGGGTMCAGTECRVVEFSSRLLIQTRFEKVISLPPFILFQLRLFTV